MSTLFRLINGLRYFGVGCKVTRKRYRFPDTYWIITKVKLSKDQNHGTALGRLVWRGKPKMRDERINGTLKTEWKLMEFPNYKQFSGSQEELVKLFPTTVEANTVKAQTVVTDQV